MGPRRSHNKPHQTPTRQLMSPLRSRLRNPRTRRAEEPAKEEKKPVVKRVKVVAAEMVKEFEKNELAADTKYKGKDFEDPGSSRIDRHRSV